MEDAIRIAFAVFMLLFGVSALAGWATAFRNRLYLAPIGLAFLALGSALAIPTETLAPLRIALWVIAVLAFVLGVWLAVAEVRREMKAIQEQRRGLEREMQEYLKRLQAEQGDTSQPQDAERKDTQ